MATETAMRFERLNYHFGQELGVAEFRTEQGYFRDKLRLHNRSLHGHGIVCGLWVKEPAAPPAAAQQPAPVCLEITEGLALDPRGNELYVPKAFTFDLLGRLRKDAKKKYDGLKTGDTLRVFVVLKYAERRLGRRRPVAFGACPESNGEEFGRTGDWYCVEVWDEDPTLADPESCGVCDPQEPGKYVLLARIDWTKGTPPDAAAIHTEVRRPVSKYPFNVVTGINWTHAGAYPDDAANDLLTDIGLTVRFRRPVQTAPLLRPKVWAGYGLPFADGAVEVLAYTSGGTNSGNVFHLPVEIAPPDANDNSGFLDRLHLRVTDKRLRLDPGTRVLVVVRGAALLDVCCAPLDAAHIGGWVPYFPTDDPKAPPAGKKGVGPDVPPAVCRERFGGDGPWVSGAGSPGGNFESWFTIIDPQGKP